MTQILASETQILASETKKLVSETNSGLGDQDSGMLSLNLTYKLPKKGMGTVVHILPFVISPCYSMSV